MGSFFERLQIERADLGIGVLIVTGVIVTFATLVAALVVNRRRRDVAPQLVDHLSAAAPSKEDERQTAPGVPLSPVGRDPDETKALLAFAQELLGATTTDQLRGAIASHLLPLVGSRRMWVSTQIRGRRNVIVAESPERPTRELFNINGQEWTTFPLRIDREVVGLLGIDSGGGLQPNVKHFVQLAMPMIAQALNTADQFESMREARLVDLLTGTATRREGLTRLGAEIKRAQRMGSSMAVLMLDLDRFKSINDRYGHAVGDAVLTEVGRILQRTLRASDSRCRWGGEEFLIVLPDTDLTRAQIVAAGLLRNIAASTVPGPSGPVGCTVSVGVTITRPGESQLEHIVRRADIALYRAKKAGRSCIRVVLGDREGNPIGHRSDDEGPKPPTNTPRRVMLPFPDRRNPSRADRRTVPSPGRRSTDPAPPANDEREPVATGAGTLVQSSLLTGDVLRSRPTAPRGQLVP
jgi:diguanylate cyclase (GGDEF)-like protein